MKAYSIFDDFPQNAAEILVKNDIAVTILPKGQNRPSGNALKELLEEYDIIIISTAQMMPEEMFLDITQPKIIATASVGMDHIHVPENKNSIIKVVNAPKANRISVAEHTFALILSLKKQLMEGRKIAAEGKSKKVMNGKSHDIFGLTIGVVGAGGTGKAVLEMAVAFGMNRMSWTPHPEKHMDLAANGVEFTDLDTLLETADIISINLPMKEDTYNLISSEKIDLIKNDAVFITSSRTEIIDNFAIMKKAAKYNTFSVGMDVDADKVSDIWNTEMNNVIVTPHIAGGTVESRKRLFIETAENIVNTIRKTRSD